MQKARRHRITRLRPLVGAWFQGLFHSPSGVLFTFPSRYWFAIGLSVVFSLTGWSPRIHAEFLVFRTTQVPSRPGCHVFAYGALTLCGPAFQPARLTSRQSLFRRSFNPGSCCCQHCRFGLLRVRSPLLAQSLLLSFPPGTEMFQFPGFASILDG